MTTLDLPLTRTRSGSQAGNPPTATKNSAARQDQLVSENLAVGNDTTADLRADVLGAGLDTDTVYSYGLDGFSPGSVDNCGCSDPQDGIDLEGLAEQVFWLLRREAYIERERQGARR